MRKSQVEWYFESQIKYYEEYYRVKQLYVAIKIKYYEEYSRVKQLYVARKIKYYEEYSRTKQLYVARKISKNVKLIYLSFNILFQMKINVEQK